MNVRRSSFVKIEVHIDDNVNNKHQNWLNRQQRLDFNWKIIFKIKKTIFFWFYESIRFNLSNQFDDLLWSALLLPLELRKCCMKRKMWKMCDAMSSIRSDTARKREKIDKFGVSLATRSHFNLDGNFTTLLFSDFARLRNFNVNGRRLLTCVSIVISKKCASISVVH